MINTYMYTVKHMSWCGVIDRVICHRLTLVHVLDKAAKFYYMYPNDMLNVYANFTIYMYMYNLLVHVATVFGYDVNCCINITAPGVEGEDMLAADAVRFLFGGYWG